MKQLLLPAILFAILLSACNGDKRDFFKSLPVEAAGARTAFRTPSTVYSKPVAIPTANRMIKSYLHSIDYQTNVSAIRSWMISADTLRNYLDGKDGKKIVRLKLMLAHTMAYIHAGGEGRQAPVNSHAITIVMVGVDAQNNLMYNAQNMPYDYAMPCPPDCLGDSDEVIGTGHLDTLVWQ